MMVARALKTLDNNDSPAGKWLIVKEMDMYFRQCKGTSYIAEDAVGASAGDLVLCSESRTSGRFMAVGIIDTVELVGNRIYDKNNTWSADEDN